MSAWSERLTSLGFRVAWGVVARLPAGVAFAAARWAARQLTQVGGEGVRQLRRNLTMACPALTGSDLDLAVALGMESYARYWCTAFRLHTISANALARCVSVQGDEPVRLALTAGRAPVCFLGHSGNWDVAGAWSARHLAPVVTVAERLRPESIFQQFLRYRERLGMTVFPLTGGSESAFTALRRASASGGTLIPLLADRDLAGSGVEVAWGEHRVRAAAGPAALALASDAPLFPVTVWESPDAECPETGGYRLHIQFHPEVVPPSGGKTREKVLAMTQTCIDRLREGVQRHPEDWHMLQPFFVAGSASADEVG